MHPMHLKTNLILYIILYTFFKVRFLKVALNDSGYSTNNCLTHCIYPDDFTTALETTIVLVVIVIQEILKLSHDRFTLDIYI